jgi:predicted alpha/beta-hydrolase family hydrolase
VSAPVAVPTPHGEGRSTTFRARRPVATLLLSHGAGAGTGARDLQALAHALPGQGITVVLFDQPWVVAGRKVATAPPTLDEGLRAAAARSAVRCASGLGAAGCLALSFPLHPPGRPERSRLDELTGAGVPTLVVQGERDAFGRPEEFPDSTEMCVVPGADHGLKVPRRGLVTDEEAMAIVVEATLEWLVREVVGESSRP